jgi:Flp pilus assembly protein TadD
MSDTFTPEPPYGPIALCRAAVACRRGGDPQLALELLERAITLDPDDAVAAAEAGLTLMALGRPGEAMARLRRAIFLSPGLAGARDALGVELLRRGLAASAVEQFAAAVQARPDQWSLHLNLGLAHQRAGNVDAALTALAVATRCAPGDATCWNALGTALHLAGRSAEAVGAYRTALELRPDFSDALGNLGCALRATGQPEAAVDCYDRVLSARPDYPEARWNRALAKLSLGHLADAWEDHEWRWRVPGFPSAPRGFTAPLWNGEAIAGQRILLHAEQGFGDTLQALRYVPLVAARGAEVVLEVPRELLRLALRVAGAAVVLARGEALPAHDVQAPLLSLPRAFATTLATIPAGVPYLSPPDADAARWQNRLGGLQHPRVGLVWAGRSTHGNDANRSLSLAALTPLLGVPGVSFVSLQAGPRGTELAALPPGLVSDVASHLQDFGDTAAAVASLDMLVSVDTAVVHLAGALGRPVHVLLPFAPDWRWLLERSDSPWYPTLHLHRQTAPGDWSTPLAEVAAVLRRLAATPLQLQAA